MVLLLFLFLFCFCFVFAPETWSSHNRTSPHAHRALLDVVALRFGVDFCFLELETVVVVVVALSIKKRVMRRVGGGGGVSWAAKATQRIKSHERSSRVHWDASKRSRACWMSVSYWPGEEEEDSSGVASLSLSRESWSRESWSRKIWTS